MTETPRLKIAAISALSLAFAWALIAHPTFNIDLNSDALYIDDLWQSFFDGRSFRLWFLPPAPSFFPDLALYAVSTLAGPDLGLRHALYAFLMAILLYGAVAGVFRRWLDMETLDSALAALCGLALYVALLTPLSGLGDLFRPSHHGGAMLAALWMLALAPQKDERLSPFVLMAWTLALAAMVVSDKMILGWGLFPLLVVLAAKRSLDTAWSLAVMAGVLMGWLALALSRHWGGPLVSGIVTTYLAAHFGGIAREGAQGAAYVALKAPALAGLALLWLGWGAWRLNRGLAFFSLVASLSMLAPMLMTGKISGRHLLPLFFIPAVFFPALVFSRGLPGLPWLGLTLALGLSMLCLAAERPRLLAPYPDDLAALEADLKDPAEVSGWAEYWQCRSKRMLSRRGLWLDPAITEIAGPSGVARYFFISNVGERPTPHTFFIMNGLDPGLVEKAAGKPLKKKKYGNTEVWFYKDGNNIQLH